MELSPQFITDFLTNLAGYLIAGLLGILLFSIMKRKRNPELADISKTGLANTKPIMGSKKQSNENHKLEFIQLGEQKNKYPEIINDIKSDTAGVTKERRNRSDIIRIAKQMLMSGASHEKIMMVLPVSEAELTLLGTIKN